MVINQLQGFVIINQLQGFVIINQLQGVGPNFFTKRFIKNCAAAIGRIAANLWFVIISADLWLCGIVKFPDSVLTNETVNGDECRYMRIPQNLK